MIINTLIFIFFSTSDSSDEIPYDGFVHLPTEGIKCVDCFMPNGYVCDGKVDCRDGK